MSTTDLVDSVLKHVEQSGSITNRECRKLLGLSYDKTIYLLGALCEAGILSRKGISSGTHYVLPPEVTITSGTIAELKARVSKRVG
jgi:predicted HTH transcriptional regulator